MENYNYSIFTNEEVAEFLTWAETEEEKEAISYLLYHYEEEIEKVELLDDFDFKGTQEWDEWMLAHYPNIRKNGRVIHTSEDSRLEGSSMESYLRAELTTYSEHTLEILHRETMEADEKGGNLLRDIIEAETKFYGYASLEDAEEKHGK